MGVDEAGEFVVLEFNRNAKRITVSHLRTYDEGPKKKETKERKPRSTGGTSSRMMDEVNSTVERSTFGDLDVLSALKEQMEGGAAPAAEPAAPAEPKKEEPAAEAPAQDEAPAADSEETKSDEAGE